LAEQQRWTAKRKTKLILQILRQTATIIDVAGKHGLTPSEDQEWIDTFLRGGQHSLKARARNAQDKIESWRGNHNVFRPHRTLGYKSQAELIRESKMVCQIRFYTLIHVPEIDTRNRRDAPTIPASAGTCYGSAGIQRAVQPFPRDPS